MSQLISNSCLTSENIDTSSLKLIESSLTTPRALVQ